MIAYGDTAVQTVLEYEYSRWSATLSGRAGLGHSIFDSDMAMTYYVTATVFILYAIQYYSEYIIISFVCVSVCDRV